MSIRTIIRIRIGFANESHIRCCQKQMTPHPTPAHLILLRQEAAEYYHTTGFIRQIARQTIASGFRFAAFSRKLTG